MPSQEVGPPEPTAAEITQAQEAEIAQAQEVETARVREAVKPFALTTAGLADQAPSNSPPPFPESGEENREIAGEVVEEPAVGLELTVDRAELSAEAMETFTESTEVLAVEPVGDAVEAVATFETQEEQSPLPEPLVRFEGIVAAEVAVTVFPAGLPGGAASSEEAGGEPGMFGFTPVRAGSGLAPTARAEGFVPRPSARYPRRRRQSGGIAGIVGVMLSGLLGMFLVYYAFNWLGGPRYDFLKFPLPGLRHTYKHLNRYRSLPRFGIDPDASFAVPKNGEPAAAKNGSRRKAETTQALEPVDEVEPVAEAELVEEIVPARKRPRVKKASAPAKPNGGRAKKAADDIAPFDIPEPDFSPAAPAAKKASPPAKPKDQPAKKAADDQPFDMPAPDPADSLPKLDFSTPGST